MTGNRDPQGTETLLREALAQETRHVAADAAFVNATLDHSVASLRKTRRRQLALTVSAVAAVVGIVGWQAPSMVDNESPGPTRHSDSARVDDGYAWAQSLPRGADADVAYVDRGTLVIGSKKVDLGKQESDYHLLGSLPGGWLAEKWVPGAQPNAYAVIYGFLSTDGEYSPYASVGRRIDVAGAAVSGDGRTVAYEGVVVRTGLQPNGKIDPSAAGSVVAHLPDDAVEIVGWAGGFVYRDAQDRFWAWSPGDMSVEQRWDAAVPDGFGYTRDGECVTVSPASLPASASVSFRLCGLGVPLTVSPDNYALMSSRQFVNLEAGVDFLTLPDSVDPSRLQQRWESGDSVILAVPDDTVGKPHSVVLVRCTVSSGLCERASNRLTSIPMLASLPKS
jgi:hypothetical protein